MKIRQAFRASRLTLFFIAMTALLLMASFPLSRISASIPMGVQVATLLFLLIQLLLDRRETGVASGMLRNQSSIMAIAWISTLPVACWLLGVPIGAALFCLGWLRWRALEGWWFALVYALLMGVSVHLLFEKLMRADLYPGVLIQSLS